MNTEPEPAPPPCVQDLVREDIEARKALGLRTYGTLLYPHNGRDALRDAYEEALDLALYLRQALLERDAARVDGARHTGTREPLAGAGGGCAPGWNELEAHPETFDPLQLAQLADRGCSCSFVLALKSPLAAQGLCQRVVERGRRCTVHP